MGGVFHLILIRLEFDLEICFKNDSILRSPLVVVFGAIGCASHEPNVLLAVVQRVAVLVVNLASISAFSFASHLAKNTLARCFLFHCNTLLGSGISTTVHLGVLCFVVAVFCKFSRGHRALVGE